MEWKRHKKKKKEKESALTRPLPSVMYARTALLLDFYLERSDVDPADWADLLVQRTITDRKNDVLNIPPPPLFKIYC